MRLLLEGRYGPRIVVSTTNFNFEMPKRFLNILVDVNLPELDDTGVVLDFKGRGPGTYGIVECELLGMPPRRNYNAAGTSQSTQCASAQNLCPICCARPPQVLFIPCLHFACCVLCSDAADVCFFCRSVITEKSVYLTFDY